MAYIAYAIETITRHQRVEKALPSIEAQFDNPKQLEFLDFVLQQYDQQGIEQFSTDNMGKLLELKYQSLPDAINHLGSLKVIRESFIGCQKYLYD